MVAFILYWELTPNGKYEFSIQQWMSKYCIHHESVRRYSIFYEIFFQTKIRLLACEIRRVCGNSNYGYCKCFKLVRFVVWINQLNCFFLLIIILLPNFHMCPVICLHIHITTVQILNKIVYHGSCFYPYFHSVGVCVCVFAPVCVCLRLCGCDYAKYYIYRSRRGKKER